MASSSPIGTKPTASRRSSLNFPKSCSNLSTPNPIPIPIHPVLAIDHGEARIGLAATDLLGITAHPVETIHCSDGDPLDRISEIIAQRCIQHLVLGLPLRMDGSEGDAAAKIRAFGRQVAARFPDLPLDYADERLSTVAAAEKLRSAGKKAKNQKDLIDQAAAIEILNDWLGEQPLDPPGSAEA